MILNVMVDNQVSQIPSVRYLVRRFETNSRTSTHILVNHLVSFGPSTPIKDPMGEPGLCSRCKGTGGEDRAVACTVLEGGPCSACKERRDIRGQIKRLEEEIIRLKDQHHALGTTMNAIHDPFIHKLPPDISSHIFSLCLPSLGCQISDFWSAQQAGWNMPLRLGAVCRKWRQVAWAMPNLWVAPLLKIEPWMVCSLAQSLPDLFHE